MREIDIRELAGQGGLRIGQVEDEAAATGITVIIAPEGMPAGLDVRGGGPASRDTRVLDPLAAAEFIHAVVLGGGSAYGLDAAGGVMRYLEERGIGLDVGVPGVKVPLVCQSDIFDLGVGASDVRPDAAMGYAACESAFGCEPAEQSPSPEASRQNAAAQASALFDCRNDPDDCSDGSGIYSACGNYRDGSFGAGCGATVGKLRGPQFMQKAGIGSYAVQAGPLMVGAIVVVNALGDVVDPTTGTIVAGAKADDGSFADSARLLAQMYEAQTTQAQVAKEGGQVGAQPQAAGAQAAESHAVANTTIGVIITNGALGKSQLCKVAGMGHDGMARAIRPVHTSMDGDSLYAVSVGDVPASPDIVGTLAAEAVAQAILRAVE